MSVSMFYSAEAMTANQWFGMLVNEIENQGEEQEPSAQNRQTRIYAVKADEEFVFNDAVHEAGVYYMRARPEQAEELNNQPLDLSVGKLSFSDIVYVSDLFTAVINKLIPEENEIDRLIDQGEAACYFKNELSMAPAESLETMRQKVWTKYFDQGIMGFVYRFFSALANFFKKYNNIAAPDTNVFWPGNSCHYADQVIQDLNQKLNKIKPIYIQYAYKASKEIVSDSLGVPLEELENLEMRDLKKFYNKKVLQLHPDKNQSDPKASEKFEKINRTWGDFVELRKLKQQFQAQISELEEEFSESEERDSDQKKKLFTGNQAFAAHQFKHLLKLPAPIDIG